MKELREIGTVYSAPPSIERAKAWLESGSHAAAYGDALVLLARQPENCAAVEVFVRAAACAERQDEGAEVLRGFRHRIDPIGYACAQASMSLLAGDLATARGCAEGLATIPEAGRAYLDMMVAIAEREEIPETILERMRERERRIANFPFAWLPARWEVQGRLGQHADVLREAAQFEQSIPAQFPGERRIVRLQRAMANHNALRFEESEAWRSAWRRTFLDAVMAVIPSPLGAARDPASAERRHRRNRAARSDPGVAGGGSCRHVAQSGQGRGLLSVRS